MSTFILSIDWMETSFEVIGGLGIFLYGMSLMSDSLKKLAGNKLKLFLEKTTNTPLKGIFVGILLTALIQSSSATSALVVGLVRAGLMTLPQAVGVIFGANLGTTFTSVIISLDIDRFVFPIIFIGSFLIFFIRKRKVQTLGRVILGFGLLFFGLETMGGALKELAGLQAFKDVLLSVEDKPILGVIVGVLTTAIIQSSSATIGILQQLFETGTVPLVGAIAVVLGDNIGTTVTSIFASIGGTSSAKRTALVHVLFNMFGTVVFLILLRPYSDLVAWIASNVIDDYLTNKLTISISHVLFNLMTIFVLYFFIKQIVWLVTKLIPSRGEFELEDVHLDELLLKESPDLAIENSNVALKNMSHVATGMFEFVYSYAMENDDKSLDVGLQCETLLDSMEDKIHNYLVQIATSDLGPHQMQKVAKNIDTISDYERIGDHLDNLFELFNERKENKLEFDDFECEEMNQLFRLIRTSIEEANKAYFEGNQVLANHVIDREKEIDKLVKSYRICHINRINDPNVKNSSSGYYIDILSNLERIGDHLENIALNTINESFSYHKEPVNID
ncbi:MAG TPA: Na/Pi cotransporter family protein [Candidatus Izemoplasmatales bacterium]|nr:Na/Pi cotransporter family protein [Candidatus Izemoplasmatales bacterium]